MPNASICHTLINDALIAAMDVVGDKFGKGELFIPEMMVAAMTMKKGLAVIQPLLERTEAKDQTTVLMATVKGDMHDIGKNFVSLMLECAGFHVIDIGIDIPVETMIRQIRAHRPPDTRAVGAVDHHHARAEKGHRRPGDGRAAPSGSGHRWRCTGGREIRR